MCESEKTYDVLNLISCERAYEGDRRHISMYVLKISGTSIQPLAGHMTLTSSHLTSPVLSPSVLRLRSCSPAFFSETISHAWIPGLKAHALVFRRISFTVKH